MKITFLWLWSIVLTYPEKTQVLISTTIKEPTSQDRKINGSLNYSTVFKILLPQTLWRLNTWNVLNNKFLKTPRSRNWPLMFLIEKKIAFNIYKR